MNHLNSRLFALTIKSLMAACFGLLLASLAPAEESTETPQYLFVLNAGGVKSGGGKVTLENVYDKTIFFSDRPDRIAGHTPTAQFVQEWDKGEDNFAENNPNATLSVFGDAEVIDAVVVLSHPVLADGNLTYDIEILEGTIPPKGGECSLFIDIIGRPMTPVSVAGVARRTTRRRILFGTAATAAAVSSYPYASTQPTTVVVNTPPPQHTTTVIKETTPASTTTPADSPEQKLTELKGMLDKGLISQEEYDAKKKEILDAL